MPTDRNAEQVENLCYNIAYLRRRHGLTKKEMALALGIGVRSLSMIEQGKLPRNLGVVQVFFVTQLFRVSMKSLLSSRLDEEKTE